MDGPAHAPHLCEGAIVPEGALDVFDGETPDPNAQGELGGGHDLSLDAAGVRDGLRKLGLGHRAIQVVSGQAERVHLGPRNVDGVLAGIPTGHPV